MKNLYPWFFRVMASEVHLSIVRVEVLKHFGWSTLTMIQASEKLFSSVGSTVGVSGVTMMRRMRRRRMMMLTTMVIKKLRGMMMTTMLTTRRGEG
jgi:hypothetical protein